MLLILIHIEFCILPSIFAVTFSMLEVLHITRLNLNRITPYKEATKNIYTGSNILELKGSKNSTLIFPFFSENNQY